MTSLCCTVLLWLPLLYVFIHPVLCSAGQSRSSYTVKESHGVLKGWVPIASASPTHTIHLQIALRQQRFDELERHLYEGELWSSYV